MASSGAVPGRTAGPPALAYADAVLRRRWLAIAVCVIATLASALGLRHLEFSTDYRVFFSEDNPELAAFEALQDVYGTSDNLLFVVRTTEGDAFAPETLVAVQELTERAWQLPFATRVASVTNFQHSFAEGDDLTVEDLVPDGPVGEEAARRARRIALAEPLLRDRLVAGDGETLAVNVTFDPPQKNRDEIPMIVGEARRLAAAIGAGQPDLRIAITGQAALNNAFVEATLADLRTLVPLMAGVILLALWVFLRSVVAVAATMLVVVMSAVTALGLAGWSGILLSPPAAAAPTIILTLAVADSVHLLAAILRQRAEGVAPAPAIREGLRVNLHPIFLTSLTTVIGFLSLNFSDAPPFRDLGNITAIGVIAAWLYAVLFLPALLAIVPPAPGRPPAVPTAALSALGRAMVRRRRTVLAVSLAVVLGLGATIPSIELNDQFVDYFDPSVRFRADTDFATEHLSGIYQMHWSLPAGGSGAVADPSYLSDLAAFAAWLRARPEVVHVSTLTDTIQRLNRNLHGDDPAWHRLPADRAFAAQLLLLYEMSLPYGMDLNNQIDVDKSATRLVATLENITTGEAQTLESAASFWLDAHFETAAGVEAGGPFVMFAHISERNIRAMLAGMALALGLISLSMILALRDLRLGLISIVPNIVPVIIGFGLWAILVGEVGLAASVVAATSLGIIVDNTVHLMSRYRRARREQAADPEAAVRHAFTTVGTALFVSTAVLVAGFAILALSTFALNESLGLLTALTITAALLADVTLLPALLATLDRR